MRPDGSGAHEIGGADEIDEADTVLPPPRGLPIDPDDKLWHTGSFAAVTDEPEPRRKRKLTAGLAFLGAATTAVCTYAGVELAGIAGLNPPSPPRYVINEQANAQPGVVNAQPGDVNSQPGNVLVPSPALPPQAIPPGPATAGTRQPGAVAPAGTRSGDTRTHKSRSDGDKSDSDKSDGDKSSRRKHKSKSDD